MVDSGFRERLKSGGALLLDSAMGTELERRGARTALPLWSAWALLESPELVLAIHRDEVAAGAEILTANTFRTHRRTLAKQNLADRAAELTRTAVLLAREAARGAPRPVFVAGSLSPLEDCYRPDLRPPGEALEREHAIQAEALASSGADLILIETQNSVRELATATRWARQTGLPVIASMITDGRGHLLSGQPIEVAVAALDSLRLDALSINCVPARDLGADLERLSKAAPGVPLAAYGNLGPPTGEGGTVFTHDVPPEDYAELAREWIAAGARIVGGCCGTTNAHTAALRRMLSTS
ncbi:MAG TPA: homocysteine S-methyltransferase family protein [Thermoanaerobaculia bacterium]|nr:homocysteine S-methyltransferase family protein [Thermoanaerobaculia bacterium]